VASVEWLLIESLLAFVILVAIVAWTMAPLRKHRKPPDSPRQRSASPPDE
jgi:hypothetical protein